MDDPIEQPNTGSSGFERTKVTFDHPADSDLHDHAEARLQIGIDPKDGLPHVANSSWERHLSPALDPETLLCMEDASQYVLRDAGGGVVATFAPAEVQDGPHRTKVVHRATALARLERRTARSTLRLAVESITGGSLVAVEPIRPKCRHYARQIIDFPGEAGHFFIRRFCRANRTDEGEYESVREALVFACELRDPPDVPSEKKIHEFDAERVRLGRIRKAQSNYNFDIGAELDRAEAERAAERARTFSFDEAADAAAGGGIFNPPTK